MSVKKTTLVATFALALGLVAGVPAGSGQAAPPVPTVRSTTTPALGAVFDNGDGDLKTSKRLASMIKAAPKGSVIRAAQYILRSNDGYVVAALTEAVNDGVKVRLVLDEGDKDNPGAFPWGDAGLAKLRDAIKAKVGASNWNKPSSDSFIVLCKANKGCLNNSKDTAYQHNKFVLFSTMGNKKKVVFQSTANPYRDSYWAWNAAYSVSSSGLYSAFLDYFAALSNQKRSSWKYKRVAADSVHTAYFFPRVSTNGDKKQKSTDTIYNLLNDNVTKASCKAGTTIRIAVWGFTRENIAKKLASLADQGCKVHVAVNNSKDFGQNARKALRGHANLKVYFPKASTWVHIKTMLIEGTYAGKANQKIVFLGSHNFTYPALRSHDESWLKVVSSSTYASFKSNYTDMLARSFRQTTNF